MQSDNNNIFDQIFSEAARHHLLETTRWTKFLAILMFIFIGMMLLGLLVIIASGTMLAAMSQGFASMGIYGASLVIFLMIVLYWYPSYMLYKFSTSIRTGLMEQNQQMIENGFRYQKNMYRFAGILTIVLISFYLLLTIISVAALI